MTEEEREYWEMSKDYDNYLSDPLKWSEEHLKHKIEFPFKATANAEKLYSLIGEYILEDKEYCLMGFCGHHKNHSEYWKNILDSSKLWFLLNLNTDKVRFTLKSGIPKWKLWVMLHILKDYLNYGKPGLTGELFFGMVKSWRTYRQKVHFKHLEKFENEFRSKVETTFSFDRNYDTTRP